MKNICNTHICCENAVFLSLSKRGPGIVNEILKMSDIDINVQEGKESSDHKLRDTLEKLRLKILK